MNPLERDTYYTISGPAEAQYSEKRSKFLAFAFCVETEAEALERVAELRQRYYDARHVCWAYRLGSTGEKTRANDDGEPSGTAGKPILGQLVSADLTQIIVLVVRYFGGIKLGTGGLIEAYREATKEVLAVAEREERIMERELRVAFGYALMGEVMRAIKESGARVLEQDLRESCALRLSIRAQDAEPLFARLDHLYGVEVSFEE